ncbi:double-strand-break repair protein rad21-like protein 1 [Dipodomys merriami]|uniref:double-strand-break repair protein rad21-like protein 1 n=1 Tax=Dipodomys merriami TaxID=94247 RepID=UPI003855D903
MLSVQFRRRRTSNTFYSQVLLSHQGSLAKVWLAAHWQKKLRKADVIECNLETTVAQIISTQLNVALRTSAHLLLGIVRIYSRKVKYLMADCQKACVAINTTFRTEVIDLPRQHLEAQYDSITLREEFHDFEFENINVLDVLEQLSHHQSRPEEITLKEDYGCVLYFQADSFGGELETVRSHSLTGDNMLLNSSLPSLEHSPESHVKQKSFICDLGDGFGDEGNAEAMIDNLLQGYQSDLLEDIHFNVKVSPIAGPPNITVVEPDNLEDLFIPINDIMEEDSSIEEQGFILESTALPDQRHLEPTVLPDQKHLEPTVVPVIAERVKKKRKKASRDQDTNISMESMLEQISAFENAPRHLKFLPPKRRLIVPNMKENPKTLLSVPCQYLAHDKLKMLFERCLRPRGFKPGSSAQKVPVRKRVRDQKNIVETLKRKNTNAEEERKQPKIRKHVTDANTGFSSHIKKSNKMGKESFSLMELCKNSNRKQAAAAFYSFLELKKEQAIEGEKKSDKKEGVVKSANHTHPDLKSLAMMLCYRNMCRPGEPLVNFGYQIFHTAKLYYIYAKSLILPVEFCHCRVLASIRWSILKRVQTRQTNLDSSSRPHVTEIPGTKDIKGRNNIISHPIHPKQVISNPFPLGMGLGTAALPDWPLSHQILVHEEHPYGKDETFHQSVNQMLLGEDPVECPPLSTLPLSQQEAAPEEMTRPTRGAYTMKMMARPEQGPAMTSAITIRELYETEILAEPEPGGAEGRHFREGALAFKDYMRLIADLDDEGDQNSVDVVNKDGGSGSSGACEGPCGCQALPQPQASEPMQMATTPQPRRKRIRKFLSWQLEEMENLFQEIQYPDAPRRSTKGTKIVQYGDIRMPVLGVNFLYQEDRGEHIHGDTEADRSNRGCLVFNIGWDGLFPLCHIPDAGF